MSPKYSTDNDSSRSEQTLNDQRIDHEKESNHSSGHLDNNAIDPTDEERVQSTPEKPTGPPPPPNGGLVAWLHVLGGFMLFFNTWGILNTFGTYQTYYESGALFNETSSNISWVGAIQSYMMLFIGFLSGPIYDRGYFRELILVGSFGIVFGHMMLSLCHTFWQVILAQGFIVGIGGGCLFIPCIAILPSYWSTKLGLAVGISAAGASVGGVVYPVAFYKLIDQVGFAWATRIIGFIALATLIIPNAVMKMRFKPPKARALIDWTVFTDGPFLLAILATTIGFIGLYDTFFYISYYAGAAGITSEAMSFYIVPIFNAASTFGRILPNALSDKTGPLNLIMPGAFIVGVLNFSLIAAKTEASLIVVAVLFGFFSGLYVALPPILYVSLTKDKSKIGSRTGMAFGIMGCGVLAGGPGGGAILGQDPNNLHWTHTWSYAGAAGITAGLLYILLRTWLVGKNLKVKV